MAETLNKRLLPVLEAERRENARRYWARKVALSSEAQSAESERSDEGNPAPGEPPNPLSH